MMPLVLVALTIGADPSPAAERPLCVSGNCPPRIPPWWFPKRATKKIEEAAGQLDVVGKVPPGGPSFLYQPEFAEDEIIRLPAREYQLQPGDIVLSADGSKFWLRMHQLAGTSHPTHSMIVFALPDGRPAILEGGPHDTAKCRILEAIPHMASYEKEGRVWVRRRKCPLTPMQSARLTEFCLAANCRDFAMRRLLVQITPLRTRGPIRTAFLGKPHGLERESFFCSELVCESLVYAGLLDARTTRPSATFPRDLFFGDSLNPWLHFHLPKMNASWDAPARWTGSPIVSEGK
ncbi:MAG: hypothetical protein U0791_27680 [Gemmataceae bacterium]